MSFANKVIIVTGASSGIGASIVKKYVMEAANVVIVGRNENNLSKVAKECSLLGNIPLIIKADISNDTDADNIVKKSIEYYGKIDVLVNNAGFVKHGTILGGNLVKSYDEMAATNIRAVMNLTALVAPQLIKTKGNIVNISSAASMGMPPTPVWLPYSVTKAALDYFTRASARELGEHQVRVNCINPGPVKTSLLVSGGFSPDSLSWDMLSNATALGKVSEPEEIADLVLFLSGEKAKSITGACFVNDNGFLIK